MVGEKVCENKRGRSNIMIACFRQFTVGAGVIVQDGREKSVWKPGTILEGWGPMSYLVQIHGGQMQLKNHIRQVLAPPAVVTSAVATGPSTVRSTSRVVPREDAGNMVLNTSSFEELMTPTLVTEQHEVPHSSEMSSVPSGPNGTPVRTYPHHQRNPDDRFVCTCHLYSLLLVFFSCKEGGVWYIIYDVMHDAIAVTCFVCMCSCAWTTSCAVWS